MAENRHYLRALALAVVGSALFFGAGNLLIDPYGLFQLVSRSGFNAVKPRPDHSLAEIKMATVLKYPANALIIGNSRAEIGFDPQHPVWRSQSLSAYNLAVPGSGIQNSAEQIKQLENKLHPRLVLLGLDFLDFLVNPSSTENPPPAHDQFDLRDRMRLGFASLFSIQAAADSLRTLRIQRDATPESITDRGFNPLLDYQPIARSEGYYAMFRQRAQSNAQRFARMPKGLFKNGSKSSPEWEALTAILEETLNRGGSVKIVIYPYHAQLLAMFEQYQLWPAFEAWKAHVAEVAQAVLDRHSGRIELWDFSGFSDYQCEPIPRKGDKQSVVRGYWEAGHFKKELGDVMLTRMFDRRENSNPAADRIFGMPLTTANLEQNAARVRSERETCLAHSPEIFSEALELKKSTKPVTAPL